MMQMHYTINKKSYTIKQAKSGWNIFETVPVDPQPYRVKGAKCRERFVMYVEGSHEDAHNQLIEHAKNERKLLAAIFGISEPE